MVRQAQYDGTVRFNRSAIMQKAVSLYQLKRINYLIERKNAQHEGRQIDIEGLLEDVRELLRETMEFNFIKAFGSSKNGFHTKTSDVDILVETPINDGSWYVRKLDSFLIFTGSVNFNLKRSLPDIRVPIITVQHRRTQVQCDITFRGVIIGNHPVLQNTELLKTYSLMSPIIPAVYRFFKHILTNTPFGSARTKGLSTYTHIILFLHFLIKKQLIPAVDVRCLDYDTSMLRMEEKSPGIILLEYLEYLSCELDTSRSVIDIATVAAPCSCNSDSKRLFICDPFERERNLGSYMSERCVFKFKRLCFYVLKFLLTSDSLTEKKMRCKLYNPLKKIVNHSDNLEPPHKFGKELFQVAAKKLRISN